MLGLGTYKSGGRNSTKNAVKWALETGYRHIDTATYYQNETYIGEALQKAGVPREEIFLTSKVWPTDFGYTSTLNACNASLQRLSTPYLDLYLIHWPANGHSRETWRALLTLLKQGKCRAIGVSNYGITHLDELLRTTTKPPMVDQIEFHPYRYDKSLLTYARNHHIQLESYSPLTQGQKLTDPRLLEIAQRYQKSPAQVLIRWNLQHGLVTIPKSTQKQHINANANVFDFTLSKADLHTLNAFSEGFSIHDKTTP